MGLRLEPEQIERFVRYRALLLDWNARINLTAITDPSEIAVRHFLDALSVALALPDSVRQGGTVALDVGSGGGFPGLPLAIVFPAWRVTLLEATAKKVRFLETVIAELGLLNAHAVAARAEEYAHQAMQRARYDLVMARAVSALPTLLEYCCPFARVGGRLVLPKKGDLGDELAVGHIAAGQLRARLLAPVPVRLAGLNDGRVLLVVRQEKPCPKEFPRPQAAILKKPLGGGSPKPPAHALPPSEHPQQGAKASAAGASAHDATQR